MDAITCNGEPIGGRNPLGASILHDFAVDNISRWVSLAVIVNQPETIDTRKRATDWSGCFSILLAVPGFWLATIYKLLRSHGVGISARYRSRNG